MKHLLLTIVFLLPFTLFAQNSGQGYVVANDFSSPFQRTVWWLRTAIPAGSVPVFTLSGTNSTRIHTDTLFVNNLVSRNDTTVYKLVSIGSDAMLRAFIPKYLIPKDTISLSNRLDSKLNILDTSFRWMPIGYIPDWNSITHKPNFLDSSTIYTIINGKLNISDTTGHWTSISRFVSDSIFMRAILDTKMDKADSIKFYPRFNNPNLYLTGNDTLNISNRINSKYNSIDTINKWYPRNSNPSNYLVPSDTINKFLGINTHIPVDPVNTNWNSNSGLSQILNKPSLSGYMSYTDTISLSNRINGKLSVEDTLSLSNRINNKMNFTDTISLSNRINLRLLATDTLSLSNRINAKYTLPSGGTTGEYLNGLGNRVTFPTIPTLPISDYTNTTLVSGGVGNAVFYITSDKTSTGTALYTNIASVVPIINDPAVNYTYGWSYNSGTKALTVNAKVSTGLYIALLNLTLLSSPSNVPNSTVISVLVKGN